MHRSVPRFGSILLAAGLVLSGVTVAFGAPDETGLVNLELADVDAQSAIRMLFQSTGPNYSIGPDVTGTIPSLSFKGVPFDQALKTLLKSAGLVYRIDDANGSGVYIISKKIAVSSPIAMPPEPVPVDVPVAEETTIEKVKLNNVGATELLQMLGMAQTGGSNPFGNYGTMTGSTGGGYVSPRNMGGNYTIGTGRRNTGSYNPGSTGAYRSW